jgi:hypothetical protein
MLRCCRLTQTPHVSHIIQLSIKYSDNKFERLIEVKGITGVNYYNLEKRSMRGDDNNVPKVTC